MNTRTSTHVLSVLVLLTTAGTALTSHAQSITPPAQEAGMITPGVDFRSCHWLSDRKVVNNNGEEIAVVSDFILDRGSGKVQYAVITTGAAYGMGGRAVAIPFGSFRREAGSTERFVLAMTPEQLTQFPEYTAESWKALKESAPGAGNGADKGTPTTDSNTLRLRLNSDASTPNDPYAGNLESAQKSRVEGEITAVDRVRTSSFGEQVQISVRTAGGSSQKVALGPSWFVNSSVSAPMRGDKVVVDTLVMPRDPDALQVATHLRAEGRDLQLRGSNGTPAWSLTSVDAGGKNFNAAGSRYLLLSTLKGMKIDCRGSECGTVHDVIVDRASGEIGFLSIDPNQNFMGIGDTKRLLPWSVATVTAADAIRVDASKEMVLASPETPSEPSTLNTGTHAQRVYQAFNVPAPRFEAMRSDAAMLPESHGAWSARGSITSAIDHATTTTVEGKVTDVTQVKFEKGVAPARALKIRVAGVNGGDSGEQVVLLGPAQYMDNQKAVCAVGDTIKVEACRITIDGTQHWIAKSVDCKGQRVVLLDGNGVPAWARQ